jgi:hypothetical protein
MLLNERLLSALMSFIDDYRRLDTRNTKIAPSPSGLLRYHLEYCIYIGRCEKTKPIVTQSIDDEVVDL